MNPRSGARLLRWAALFWFGLAFALWNGIFDMLVSRGEKFYLLSQARHELGLGPALTMHEVMSRTIADASRTASIWALLVFVSGLGWTWRAARRPAPQARASLGR